MKLVQLSCRCGHPREVHDHYRAGTDCGVCGRVGCERYRAAWPLVGELRIPRPRRSSEPGQTRAGDASTFTGSPAAKARRSSTAPTYQRARLSLVT